MDLQCGVKLGFFANQFSGELLQNNERLRRKFVESKVDICRHDVKSVAV